MLREVQLSKLDEAFHIKGIKNVHYNCQSSLWGHRWAWTHK